MADHFTQSGADALARRIERYWEKKGKTVNAFVTTEKMGKGYLYFVRSDMVNGLPR